MLSLSNNQLSIIIESLKEGITKSEAILNNPSSACNQDDSDLKPVMAENIKEMTDLLNIIESEWHASKSESLTDYLYIAAEFENESDIIKRIDEADQDDIIDASNHIIFYADILADNIKKHIFSKLQ